MAWGFDADQMSVDPYEGAYRSVVTSVARLVAAGCDYRKAYLTCRNTLKSSATSRNAGASPLPRSSARSTRSSISTWRP